MGVVAAQHLGGQQHGPGRAGAGEQREAVHGPVVDHQAELRGRDAEARARRRHPQVTGDGELGAGAEGRAVDRGDGGERGVVQRVEHLLQQHRERLVLDPGEVGARAEVAVRTGQHQRTGAVAAR